MDDARTRPDETCAIGWRLILGLSRPGEPSLRRAHAAALAEHEAVRPRAFVAAGFGALLLAMMLRGTVPAPAFMLWLGAGLLVMTRATLIARRQPPAAGDPAPLRRALLPALCLGILWAVPPIGFAASAGTDQQLAICLLCAGLMAAVTLTTATVPAAMAAYLLPATAGMATMMARADAPFLLFLPVAYALFLALGGIATARTFLRRSLAEQALAEKNATVSLLLRDFDDGGADWLWETDAAKRLRGVTPAVAAAAGRTIEELEGLALLDLLAGARPPGRSPELALIVDRMNARAGFADLALIVAVNGEDRWWKLSAAPRFDAQGRFMGFRGMGSDITDKRRSAERIDRMARYDALTGLANRSELVDTLRGALDRARRDGRRTGLLLVDLDRFKPVNDTLGHPVGDRVLKLVAERLRSLLRVGQLGGRLGGDEFAVVIDDVGASAALDRLAGAIIAALSQPFEVDGATIRIGASVGSAIGPADGRSVDMLVRNADLALYRAKDDGRGVHRRYDRSLLALAERKRAIETALREAIDDGGQFTLAYQPVVEAANGRIEAFEALIRWTHPTLGELAPDAFLPIAEECRLGAPLGEWVLRTACIEAAAWPESIRLAVNLSVEQLHDPALAATVLSALGRSGLAPGRLELEVSEAVFLHDDGRAAAALDALQALGVRIVLDDFGAGFAALGYVRSGRFDAIKIDRQYVRGAAAGAGECLAIVRAGVAMAHALEAGTVAEGAETRDELERVRALGCRLVQGNLAGLPMAAAHVRALLGVEGAAGADRAVA